MPKTKLNAQLFAVSADGGDFWTEQWLTESDINAMIESAQMIFRDGDRIYFDNVAIVHRNDYGYVFGGVLYPKS